VNSGIVVDASVAVKWVVEERFSDRARRLAKFELHGPDLLWIECANILWKKATKGDLTGRQASRALTELRGAPVIISAAEALLEKALAIATGLSYPVYDCIYLALAQERKMPLLTADERLARVVRERRVAHVEVRTLGEFEV
jgi:predicted nucleic acid-binding protein